jgi:hypothetical protein
MKHVILTTMYQIENLNNNFKIKKHYELFLKKFNLFEKISDSCKDAFFETFFEYATRCTNANYR